LERGIEIRQAPRPRRQVGTATLRLARAVGFRYDESRDAYILRGIGDRFGPVLRTSPPVDTTAQALEWTEAMEELAETKRRPGRFRRDPQPAKRDAKRDVVER
jgi:hypothetical protein